MSEEEVKVEEAAAQEAPAAEETRPEGGSESNAAAEGDQENRGRDSQDRGDGRMRRRPMRRRRKVCAFCEDEKKEIDYKDVVTLKKYVSERGKILPRRITGTCAKHQRAITTAVKRARHIAIMPYSVD